MIKGLLVKKELMHLKFWKGTYNKEQVKISKRILYLGMELVYDLTIVMTKSS